MSAVTISSVEGNGQKLDGGAMYGNVPRALWSRWIPPDDIGRISLACRALLIEDGPHKILCETGIGSFFEPKMADRFGVQAYGTNRLLESLAALGVKEDQIDFVILSHLHFDHAGGLLPTYEEIQAGQDRLLFPKATYVVGKEAWERAEHPHFRDRASFIPGMTDKLKKSGRLFIVEDKVPPALKDNVSFRFTSGHTPGQMHTVYRGAQSSVVFAGDLVPGVSWVHLPVTMGYDRYPELLIDEKQSLYERAVPEKWWMFYTHDPKVAASKVQKNDKGAFEAIDPRDSLSRLPL